MYNQIVKVLIFILCFSFIQKIHADSFVECSNCGNLDDVAKNSVQNTTGSYLVHVADFESGVLESYNVRVFFIGNEPGFPRYAKTARSAATPGTITNQFTEIMTIRNSLLEASDDFVVPSVVVNGAWSLYGDQQLQDNFLQYVYNNSTFTMELASLANLVTGWTSLIIDIPITLTSGAKIVISFKRLEMNSDGMVIYEINFEASRDESGNSMGMPNVGGSPATFTSGEASVGQAFMDAADRAGYTVHTSGSSSDGGSMSCTLVGTVLTCIYTRPN